MKQQTNYDKVRDFHKSFGLALDEKPTQELMELRSTLISEEYIELLKEIRERGPLNQISYKDVTPNLIKEMCDLLYVVYGTAASFGIDIDTAFNRVHESNMSKLGEDGKPIYREDGKALKGPNYKPPVMEDLVP